VLFMKHQLCAEGAYKIMRAFEPFALFDGAAEKYLPMHFFNCRRRGQFMVYGRLGELVTQAHAERGYIQPKVWHLPEPVADMGKADAAAYQPMLREPCFRFGQ